MLRAGVLVSGGGTNLQAMIDAIKNEAIKDTEISIVISNKEGAYALKRAQDNGIETRVIIPGDHKNREEYERALAKALDEAGAELVVLAGFMVVLSEFFVDRYAGKIINIHPSLIPSFCGRGCYGLKVHEQVLQRGVKITGATVHFVDSGTDTGPIIAQKAVEVRQEDTPETLQKRVMEEAEWILLPMVVDAIAHGRVRVENKIAYINK